VCLNVTLLDGLVLARSAFNSSMHYRSATVFGAPLLVENPGAKLEALRVISEQSMPGRWQELRAPHEREISMTGVIRLDIDSASAKVSSGMPDDEDDDYDIPVWAGILPLQSAFTVLQSDERILDGVAPSDIVKRLEGRKL
jgi:nitroimidazol reductase NimA-like FMN-containing flavoprotein (pyridoxamine 5'-phosphate oxidase superfamily)